MFGDLATLYLFIYLLKLHQTSLNNNNLDEKSKAELIGSGRSGNASAVPLQDFTRPLVEKSLSVSYPPTGISASFWWWDALSHQSVGIREETLESGNLFSGS